MRSSIQRDADSSFLMSQRLLVRVEVNRSYTPEIIVINNYWRSDGTGKSDKAKTEEKARYLRLFRDSKKVRYTDLTFQEFASRGFAAL